MKRVDVIKACHSMPSDFGNMAENALSSVDCSDAERAAARIYIDQALSEWWAGIVDRATKLSDGRRDA